LKYIKNKSIMSKYAGLFCGAMFGTCILSLSSIRTVPPNHIAYSNLFGNIDTKKRYSGMNFINPFAKLIKIPLLTTNFSSEIDVASSEGLSLSVQIDTIYKIDGDSARDVYLKFGFMYEKILVKPMIESILRNIMASYEAKALYSDKTRHEIQFRMQNEIQEKLGNNGIIVNDVLINKIRLPLQLQASIENKLRVEQENDQMAFTIEKKRKEIAFNLEKERVEAERKEIEANGISKFQKIVSQGISPELIKWKSIEATSELAKSNNAKIVVFGDTKNGGMPVIMGGN
jgi:prohibitin 1